ncbi:type II toxin-antitoxin system RelE/ParE family toxin [Bdellovibrionota bacterium FG-1]
MKLIWSERAWNDLIQIGEFIAQSAPQNARKHTQLLLDRAKQAAQLPQSGRVVPECVEENLRELIEGNYRIVYEIDSKKKTVTVITVFEGHQLLPVRK